MQFCSFCRFIVFSDFSGSYSFLQDIDIFACKCFVHAADSTEFAAHAAGVTVIVFGTARIADRLCGHRIERALKLGIPVKDAACVAHSVVDVAGMGDSLGVLL